MDADKRLSAEAVLEHRWIVQGHEKVDMEVDMNVVKKFREFNQSPEVRHC